MLCKTYIHHDCSINCSINYYCDIMSFTWIVMLLLTHTCKLNCLLYIMMQSWHSQWTHENHAGHACCCIGPVWSWLVCPVWDRECCTGRAKKICYLWKCSTFFHQICSAYRGGFRPHILQISLQYLVAFKHYSCLNLNVHFSKWTSN